MSGRETDGRIMSNPDGSLYSAVTQPSAEPVDAALDAEDVKTEREMLRLGLSREEVARLRGRDPEQVGKPSIAVPTLAGVEAELARLADMRKSDSKQYWREENQRLEVELIAARDRLKEGRASVRQDTAAGDDLALREIEGELDEIAKLRKTDARAYRQEAVQQRERELLQARAEAQQHAQQAERVGTVVQSVLDAVPDAEAFEGQFDVMFKTLPEQSQALMRDALAMPVDPPRPARPADVERFASTPAGAACVRAWGKDAGKKVAIVRDRLDLMRGGDGMDAATRWFDGLADADAEACLLALAGR